MHSRIIHLSKSSDVVSTNGWVWAVCLQVRFFPQLDLLQNLLSQKYTVTSVLEIASPP
jgi:hypothetical protein